MRKYFKALLIFSIISILFSCEKEAKDIELPQVDPKLVVFGFLSPSDSLIEIAVSKSVPYFGVNSGSIYDPVTDAVVLLSSSNNTISIPYSIETSSYIFPNNASFPILEGETYTLQVSSPGGFYVSGKTTVPAKSPQQVRVEVDSSFRTSNGFSETVYRIVTLWQDEPGINNYYQNQIEINQDSLKSKEYSFTVCSLFKNDQGANGQELSINCNYSNYYYENNSMAGIQGNSILYTTDISYYKYHVSLNNYVEDNPFAEPSRIYSNIEGGLGCLGSYLVSKVEF